MAEKFLSMLVSQHKLLKCITNDYDSQFCIHFWDELINLLFTTLTFSIALHPQTNGTAKVMNYTMEQLLYIHT